jgi:hypothetical protein
MQGIFCYRVTSVYSDQGIICESPLSDTICVKIYLGVNEVSGNKVIIFPNPAGDYLMIRSEEDILSIRLFNSLGTMIKQVLDPQNNFKLGVIDCLPGICLIEIELANELIRKKIILQ